MTVLSEWLLAGAALAIAVGQCQACPLLEQLNACRSACPDGMRQFKGDPYLCECVVLPPSRGHDDGGTSDSK